MPRVCFLVVGGSNPVGHFFEIACTNEPDYVTQRVPLVSSSSCKHWLVLAVMSLLRKDMDAELLGASQEVVEEVCRQELFPVCRCNIMSQSTT